MVFPNPALLFSLPAQTLSVATHACRKKSRLLIRSSLGLISCGPNPCTSPSLPALPSCPFSPARAHLRLPHHSTLWSQGSVYQVEFHTAIVLEHAPDPSFRPLLEMQPFLPGYSLLTLSSRGLQPRPPSQHSYLMGLSALWAHVIYTPH